MHISPQQRKQGCYNTKVAQGSQGVTHLADAMPDVQQYVPLFDAGMLYELLH